MELPPDDLGPDLDEMLLLPDQGLLLPELPADDMLGGHLTDHDRRVGQLGDIMEVEDHDLVPTAPPEALEMDICEMCDAVALPDDISRVACSCKRNCVKLVMMKVEGLVHHLRTEVRDKQFLLEFVKQSHLSEPCPRTRHRWKLAGITICFDALIVLVGISNARLTKTLRSIRTSGICPYSDLRSLNGGSERHVELRLDVDALWHVLLPSCC